MSNIPTNLLYTEDHEWVLFKGKHVFVGITHHAQDQLGDIVYLGDFASVGDSVDRGDVIGVIESVKATSDIFAPISGSIVEINVELVDGPEAINDEAYYPSWMVRMKLEDVGEMEDLLSPDAYERLTEE